MEYKDEQLVCQYGSQFNWFKYICCSKDENKANIKAFINDDGEISFNTSREIEIGEEFLYTFGEGHHEQENDKDHKSMYKQSCMLLSILTDLYTYESGVGKSVIRLQKVFTQSKFYSFNTCQIISQYNHKDVRYKKKYTFNFRQLYI